MTRQGESVCEGDRHTVAAPLDAADWGGELNHGIHRKHEKTKDGNPFEGGEAHRCVEAG